MARDWSPSGMWPVDLHCHTAGRSPDSTVSPLTAVADAAAHGARALCLTEHDAIWQAEELAELGRHAAVGCAPIPGAEINTDDGHVLAYGLDGYRFGFHHARVLARAVRDSGGALVFAHPYRRALPEGAVPGTRPYEAALERALENPLVRLVDAVEVVNGRGTEAENRFARDLARAAGLPGVAGSDAHRAGDAGRVTTVFDGPVLTAADLARALRSGRFRVSTGHHTPASR